jgi:hypothetical protein
MAALLKNIFAAMGPNKPNPITAGQGFNSGTLIGRPTPIPSVPGYNPLGKKKPQNPSPIPGVPSYGLGMKAPTQGRGTLLG